MQQEQPGSLQDQVQVRVQALVLVPVACAGGLSAQPARWRLQGRISQDRAAGAHSLADAFIRLAGPQEGSSGAGQGADEVK